MNGLIKLFLMKLSLQVIWKQLEYGISHTANSLELLLRHLLSWCKEVKWDEYVSVISNFK